MNKCPNCKGSGTVKQPCEPYAPYILRCPVCEGESEGYLLEITILVPGIAQLELSDMYYLLETKFSGQKPLTVKTKQLNTLED